VSLKAAYSSPEARAKMSAAAKEVMNRPEVRAKKSAAMSKPCTIDGITIYASRKELIAELGQGKNGLKNKNFRYI